MKKNNKVNPLTHFNNVKANSYRRANDQMSNFKKLVKRYQDGGEGGPKPTPTPTPSPSPSPSPSPQSQQTPKGPISDNDLMMAMLEKGISPRDMKKVMKAKTKVAVNPNTVIDAAGNVVTAGINAISNRGGGGGPGGFKKGGSTRKMQKGGSLKPVPAGKVGLSKLPTPVRNKMGYQKKGGSIKRK
jgi:hypothetical protein